MTNSKSKTELRAMFLVAVMIVSVAGGSIAFSGAAVAANPSVDINEITVNGDDVAINTSQDPSERFVSPKESITLNYSINPANANESITSATVTFEAVNDKTVVERDVTAGGVTERLEDIEAPSEEGFYKITLEATDENSETDSETVTADGQSGFLAVYTDDPTVGVLSPDDSGYGTYPVVEGTAQDGAGIQNVTLAIENKSSGDYWNKTSEEWENSEVEFEVNSYQAENTYGYPVSWSYDVFDHKDKFGPGEYTITANAYDGLGNTISNPDGPPEVEDGATLTTITYELAPTPPRITDIEFLESDLATETDTIREGNKLGVNVTIDPRDTSPESIKSVTIESSSLGLSSVGLDENTSYNDGDKLRYQTTATINQPDAPGGLVDMRTKVALEGPNDVTRSDSVELIREPDGVEGFSVDAEFIGVVRDDADTIDMSISGIVDETGDPVDVTGSDSLKMKINDDVVASGIKATYGEVSNPSKLAIDPDDLSNTQPTGEASVKIVHVDPDGEETTISDGEFTVNLVHEAYDLEDNQYQPVGTPMEATDVSIDSDDAPSMITWDPSADAGNGTWTSDFDETKAGTGYFVYTEDRDARIGYTFETESVSTGTETLEGGDSESQYYFVGATPVLNASTDSISINDDMKGGEAGNVDESKVTAYTDSSAPWIGPDASGGSVDWNEANIMNDDVEQFEAYWVEIDSEEQLKRIFDTEPYDPQNR